jgi:hypothetical protein
MKNNIWALVFLIAGTLLATTALTTIVPAAYAEDNSAEDDSLAQQNDCDENEISGEDTGTTFNDLCENSVDGGFTANDGSPP